MSLISRLQEAYRRVRYENSLVGLEECRLDGSGAPSGQARRLRNVQIAPQSRDAFSVPLNSQLEFIRTLHGRCRLITWIGVLHEGNADGPVNFSVEVHDRNSIRLVAERQVHQFASAKRWLRLSA